MNVILFERYLIIYLIISQYQSKLIIFLMIYSDVLGYFRYYKTIKYYIKIL